MVLLPEDALELEIINENLVRFAHNWNDGMLECWNNGLAPFGQINAYGGSHSLFLLDN